jgi:hypothetical protein
MSSAVQQSPMAKDINTKGRYTNADWRSVKDTVSNLTTHSQLEQRPFVPISQCVDKLADRIKQLHHAQVCC